MIQLSGINFKVFRDDLIDPIVSGNKLHKLSPNIRLAKQLNCTSVLSFGGAYSNHLHALAWASRQADLTSYGVVRGELQTKLTPTLRDCENWGMKLIPMQRARYRQLQEWLSSGSDSADPRTYFARDIASDLPSDIPHNSLLIPEGGSNLIAINSVEQAYKKIFSLAEFSGVTHAVCATGTGATVAGLYKAAPQGVNVIGVQAVAEGDATMARIERWLGHRPDRLLITPGHLGGFAKRPAELLNFLQNFESKYKLPLEPIYTGKVMFKLSALAQEGFFSKSDNVLVIHTGGLQGTRSPNLLG